MKGSEGQNTTSGYFLRAKISSATSEMREWKSTLIVVRLSDIWLNKMVFEGIFVKTDPEISKAHANKRLVT